jgi:hypothetical protein
LVLSLRVATAWAVSRHTSGCDAAHVLAVTWKRADSRVREQRQSAGTVTVAAYTGIASPRGWPT